MQRNFVLTQTCHASNISEGCHSYSRLSSRGLSFIQHQSDFRGLSFIQQSELRGLSFMHPRGLSFIQHQSDFRGLSFIQQSELRGLSFMHPRGLSFIQHQSDFRGLSVIQQRTMCKADVESKGTSRDHWNSASHITHHT
jgi:hypothetical protein